MARIGKAGLVLEKTLSREDLSLQIARLEGQLESKRSILAELRGFFDTSVVAATLAIETNMNQLVTELEVVKGQLRVLHDRASLVRIEIDFQFKERDRVTEVVSPFEWLNTVDLQRFIEDFQSAVVGRPFRALRWYGWHWPARVLTRWSARRRFASTPKAAT
jgi:hypothetical protein